MDHSYQLSRPSIETIIDYCNDLLADEKLTVFEFGENCDLVLHIYKDEEFNPALDKDYSHASENIWKASTKTAAQIHTRFQANTGSRKVRMSSGYTEVGIAIVEKNNQTYVAEIYLK